MEALIESRMDLFRASYKKPGRLDDLLTITARLLKQRANMLLFQQLITSEQTLLTRATVRVACLRADILKSVPIPRALAARFGS